MKNDDQTLATKADVIAVKGDIRLVKADIGLLSNRVDSIEAKMATKEDLLRIDAKIDSAVIELKQYFNVMVETMNANFKDAFTEGYQVVRHRQQDHEQRIGKLESKIIAV